MRVKKSELDAIYRAEYGRAVSVLTRAFGDLDLAEDVVQDAFAAAARRWSEHGPPPSPAGWIITAARNRALDRLRREKVGREKLVLLSPAGDAPEQPEDEYGDDRLRLIFTCCHPALGVPARVALTLRLIGGLTTAEIARAFLVPEPTMAQRLVRAKAKIRDAHIPYRIPDAAELPERLEAVLATVYLIFNEGHSATTGDALTRDDLAAEAIRLGRLLVALLPHSPEATGLLALMLLAEARRPARVGADGEIVLLADQDRSLWDPALIAEGQELVRACLRAGRPGPYQIQAAINAVHCTGTTDWTQVLALYDQLLILAPGPVASLNRAVAVAEVEGPAAALALVDALPLHDYQLFHAVRADLLRRLGREEEAVTAYDEAIARTSNGPVASFLGRQRQAAGRTPAIE
jgi:RNA polymerase sigma-70 factor, ECF subfamily